MSVLHTSGGNAVVFCDFQRGRVSKLKTFQLKL